VKRGGFPEFNAGELTTMVMESSTREVWVSYWAVCYQDIPRFDAGVDDCYPEDGQTAPSRHPSLVNQEHGSSVWSQSETVICALVDFPSKKLIAKSDSSEGKKGISR
jgi:hypothetical protein